MPALPHDYDPDAYHGLAYCRVCGGGEGSLPTECPGVRMTLEENQRVYAGALDVVDGQWVLRRRAGLVIRIDRVRALPGTPLDSVDPYPVAPRPGLSPEDPRGLLLPFWIPDSWAHREAG